MALKWSQMWMSLPTVANKPVRHDTLVAPAIAFPRLQKWSQSKNTPPLPHLQKLYLSLKVCMIYLMDGGEPVACRLGRTVRFATLTDGGRTSVDKFNPLHQAKQLIPTHVHNTILTHNIWGYEVRLPKTIIILVMGDFPSTWFWVHSTPSPPNYSGWTGYFQPNHVGSVWGGLGT